MNNCENTCDILRKFRRLIKNKHEYFSKVPREVIFKITDDKYAESNEVISEIIEAILSIPLVEDIVSECAICFAHMLYKHSSSAKNIKDDQLDRLAAWFHRVYEESSDIQIPLLIAIANFIKMFPKYGKTISENVVHPTSGILTHLEAVAEGDINNWQYVLPILQFLDAVFYCLEITALTDLRIKVCTRIVALLIQIHHRGIPANIDTTQYSFFVLNSLILLQNLIIICADCRKEHTDQILGLAKAYMFYNEETYKSCVPRPIQGFQQMIYKSVEVDTLDSAAEYKLCKRKVPRLHKPRVSNTRECEIYVLDLEKFNVNGALGIDIRVSDSDASEQDIRDVNSAENRQHFIKIRLAAIKLLAEIAQEKRVLYSYWHIIFPCDLKSTHSIRDDILYVSQKDPSLKCRHASLQVATQLIFGSKGFLNQAEYSSKNCTCAFQSFSQNLGLSILALYDTLSAILTSECFMSIVIQALKCLSTLIEVTPFYRMECTFVKQFLIPVQELVSHSDIAVQLSALTVFEFLILIPELPVEISEDMRFPKISTKECNENIINSESIRNPSRQLGDIFWLLKISLQSLNSCESNTDDEIKVPASIRMKSLQLLSAMTAHFKILIYENLDLVEISIKKAFDDHQSDIRLYASRFLDNCAFKMGIFLLDNCDDEYINNCLPFWSKMLPIIMKHIENDGNIPTFKVCLCDALSNIGVVIFEHLSSAAQINLLSFLSSLSSEINEETTVRAAAARALAVFALFPSLRDNLVFIENTAESILRLVSNSNLIVRIKTIWALGNVSDALLSSSTTNNLKERISDSLLLRMIHVATTACNDNDKVRCNAVRNLGNLLRLLTENHLNSAENRMLVKSSINKLIECLRSAGNAKVKWNSCYAIGSLMRNDSLFLATSKYEDLDWQSSLYSALSHVIQHHSNYKVRINAVSAILCVSSRTYYGNYFEIFWCTVLEAIEQSYNLNNFYEYNHRDQLQEQLCLVMCHIIKHAKLDDFIMLRKLLSEKLEIIKNTWVRVASRMIPEKCATLYACPILLQEFMGANVSNMNADQKRSIEFIIQTITIPQ